ncbi:hypothetical protein CMI37_29735 [Candidatus Pacearchaeota archaeon]|nr:hypothetical protein [Candidatus Pacearchaeota archaeon]
MSGANNQNFAQVYECLRRSSVGNDNSNSRSDEYSDIPCANLIGAAGSAKVVGTGNERAASNTVSRACKMTQFLGLQTSPNAASWDTSIVGETRVTIQLNGNECALMTSDAASADAGSLDWQLTDCAMHCDVISFSSPEYDMIMSSMLSEGNLLIPYNEITSSKSLLNSSIRFNVASSSLDMIGFALLNADHGSATHLTTASGASVVSDFGGLSPNQVKFQYRNSSSAAATTLSGLSDSVDATYYWTVNGQVHPSSGATQIVNGSNATKDTYAANKSDYNSLFMDYCSTELHTSIGGSLTEPTYPSANSLSFAKQYKRVNYLNQNCIVCHRLCLDVPAAESDRRLQSGVNTLGQSSQIILNLTGFNNSTDSALLMGQGSAVLTVSAGQQVAVVA